MDVIRQTNEPLFKDIFWSRPERADLAGSLVIIGGNRDALKAPMTAYSAAEDAGVGAVRILLPDVLRKQLGTHISGLDYLPSTPSGGIGKEAFNIIRTISSSADRVLLAGDFARSSETSQLLEKLCLESDVPLTITGDALDALLAHHELLNNQQHTLVANPGQFQKLLSNMHWPESYQSSMPLDTFNRLLTALPLLCSVVVLHSQHVWVKIGERVIATKRSDIQNETTWQVAQAARSSVFVEQHPTLIFEALVSSCIDPASITHE